MTAWPLAWQPPEDVFVALAREAGDIVFLHSSMATGYSGKRSILAFGVREAYRGQDWNGIARFLDGHAATPEPSVFGYLGYGLLHGIEAVERTAPSFITLADCQLRRFAHVLIWDHATTRLILDSDTPDAFVMAAEKPSPIPLPLLSGLTSNLTKAEYLDTVEATRRAIWEGDFYQANITRKFFGEFETSPDGPSLFLTLAEASPSPYSAYLRFGPTEIISSSPELFLRLDPAGQLESRPIKGTLRRRAGQSDTEAHVALGASLKDRAENLMIVDLMRNDFARVCVPGSVRADRRFEIDSFRTLHHLSSDIAGQLGEGLSPLDAVRAAFPPGSMTGAPKIAAMRWCAAQEGMERGVYSGALGWFGHGTCELSVVIRTLLIEGNRFEFQVGGGIVADSDPMAEWEETLVKARAMAGVLGISEARLSSL